jgi:hypothetical protein
MTSIAFYLLLLITAAFSGLFFNLAFRLWRADRIESEKSAARAGGFIDALLGRTRVHDDWVPDARVKGGLIFNRAKKRFEISGRLSNDSLNRVYR